MPVLNLTEREVVLVDKALWMLMSTDEDPEITALEPVRAKLAALVTDRGIAQVKELAADG